MNFIENHTSIYIKTLKVGETYTCLLDTLGQPNKVVGNVVAGIPVVDVVDESLDSTTFIVKNYARRKPFREFDYVLFNNGDETLKFFVLFDRVKSYSRLDNTYEHTIACVELTKILEKVKIFNLNLTNQKDTLSDQINKALTNAEILVNGAERRFQLSGELIDFLQYKQSRDFYFSNTDLRSVLDEMLAPYNARITVEDVELDDAGKLRLMLGYHALDIVQDVAPKWTKEDGGEIIFEELENDGQDSAGKIVARGYNSIASEPITFTDCIKSASDNVDDESAMIFFPFPISDKGIKSLVLKNITIRWEPDSILDGHQEIYVTCESVDLSRYLIPQEQYDLLSAEESRKYLPYTIGRSSLSVGMCYSVFLGITRNIFLEVVKDAVSKVSTPPVQGYSIKGVQTSIFDMVFTCTYYPLIDTVADISKPLEYDKNKLAMGIMDSQTEQTLDIDRHGKKLTGLIKRTGNDGYCLDVKAKTVSALLPVTSRIDLPWAADEEEKRYVLYKREYSVYDNFVNCRYYFSKDHNAINQTAGINREKHLYDIPLESDETPIVIKRYLQFSRGEELTGTAETKFHSALAYSALSTLLGRNVSRGYQVDGSEKTAKGKLNYLHFSTAQSKVIVDSQLGIPEYFPPDGNWDFVLPLCNYALGNTMNFAARPLDNYSVGYSRDGYVFSLWGDGGYKIAYNPYVSTKESFIGEFDRAYLYYSFERKKDFDSEAAKKLPTAYTPGFVSAMADYAAGVDGNVEPDCMEVTYFKDRTQRPLFVLTLECIPAEKDKRDLIIGTEFCRRNNLVRDNGDGLTGLSLYVSTITTFKGDENELPVAWQQSATQKTVTDYFEVEEVVNGTTYGARLKCKKADTATSWAIADANGNIFLACNGELQDVYVRAVDLIG